MYEIVKNVIQSQQYELTGVLRKIDTLWFEGTLTDEQRAELRELAQTNAKAENSYAPLQNQIDTLFANVKELAQEILALKNGGVAPEVPTSEYPEYVQPTGAHDSYKIGDKVTYKGKKYECLMNGCVWTPEDYPQGWKLIEDVVEDEGVPEEETE